VKEPLTETYELRSQDSELQVLDIAMQAIRNRVDRGELSRTAPIRITEYLSDWAETFVRSQPTDGS